MTERQWIIKFADKLNELMRERNMTPSELAYVARISEKTLIRYLTGTGGVPKAHVASNLAYVLRVSIKDLVDYGEKIVG